MNTSTKIAIAVVGGYVLGRRRKARMAIMLGSWLVGSRLNLDIKKLGQEAVRQLASHAEIVKLGGSIREEFVQAARGAALTAVTGRMEGLSERLHAKTSALSVPGQALDSRDEDERDSDSDSGEPRDADESRDAAEPRESDDTHEDGDEAPAKPRARRSTKDAAKSADGKAKSKAKPVKRAARRRTASDDEQPRTPRKRSTSSDRPSRPSRSRSSSRGSSTS